MTAVSDHAGRAAGTRGTRRGLPRLIGHQFRYDMLCYLRNTQSVVFTLLLPVLFLVILASIFRSATVTVPGGTIKESVYYVPALIAYAVITAAFSNLAPSVFCSPGFAAATPISNADAAQPVISATVLPLFFISGIIIPSPNARLAVRYRLHLPRPSASRRHARRLQPVHHRIRAELGLPRRRPDSRPDRQRARHRTESHRSGQGILESAQAS